MKKQQLFSQSWAEVTSGERNAIVFEHLNQSYGAYEIRENYDRTLLKTFSATAVFILIASVVLLVCKTIPMPDIKIPTYGGTTFNPPINPDPPVAPINPDPPRPPHEPNRNLQPTISTDATQTIDSILIDDSKTHLTSTGAQGDTDSKNPFTNSSKGSGGELFPDDTATRSITDLIEIPRFPGGEEKLYQFLKNNTHIPQEIIEIGAIRERVGITFVVDKDGSIINAVLIQNGSRYMQLNNEAMRVIKKMPKWEPGRQNGNPVKVQMVLPIRFEVK